MDKVIKNIVKLAEFNPDIDGIWLYGSRARGTEDTNSDYDLAVIYKNYEHDPIERRTKPELQATDWQQQTGANISVVDISQAPLPLAYTVIQDNCLLHAKNISKCMETERIIMSKWEIDHLYHRKHYA